MTALNQESAQTPTVKPRVRAPIQDDLICAEYGTKVASLTPNAIACTARSDMEARDHNRRLRATKAERKAKGLPTDDLPKPRRFAFASPHVSKAKDAADLIRLAIEGRTKGLATKNANTYRVYCDPQALEAARRVLAAN